MAIRKTGEFPVDGDESLLSSLTPSVTNDLEVLRGQAVPAITQKAGARPARRQVGADEAVGRW